MPEATAAGGARRRDRTMPLVGFLLVLGAAAVWAATRMDWVEYTYANGLQPPVDGTIDGAGWASELTPLAIVLLAAIAAMFAVRGWAQRIVGIIAAATGAGILVRAIGTVASSVEQSRVVDIAKLRPGDVVTTAQAHPGGAVLAAVGGLLALVAGLVLIARPRPKQSEPSKYVTPAARRDSVARVMADRRAGASSAGAGRDAAGAGSAAGGEDELSQRLLWEALDAGADPTDGEPGESAGSAESSGSGDDDPAGRP